MPQFNLADAAPQILWLALIFLILYLSMVAILPKLDGVVEDRKTRIAADLSAAEGARAAAEGASSTGSSALAEARSHALKTTGKARDEAAATNAARLRQLDEELERKANEAADRLRQAKAGAVAELDTVASEAVVDLVRRVADVSVSNGEAVSAVKKVAA